MEIELDKVQSQQVLLEMMDRLIEFFDKHNLRYYMVGGTLLGAVRHQGFIPWDDDVDLGMPRPDYERFLDLVKTEPIAPELKVLSGRDKTLSMPHCEVINTDTRVEKETAEYIREDCLVNHLFIDIMPQDGWPSDDEAARKLDKKMTRYRYLIQNGRARLGKGTTLVRALMKAPLILYMRIVGVNRIIDKMEAIAKQYDYDKSDYVGAITMGIYGPGERCLRSEVAQTEHISFEGRSICAPGGKEKYLSQIFGDYMQLPPENQRKDHRMTVWIKSDI